MRRPVFIYYESRLFLISAQMESRLHILIETTSGVIYEKDNGKA